MGGIGSGTWLRTTRKTTVEECLTLRVSDFKSNFSAGTSGSLVWRVHEQPIASIHYQIRWHAAPTVYLSYGRCHGEQIELLVTTQTTNTSFGRERRWFTCPLVRNRAPCRRRVANLYLPPGAKYFGCRSCHDLTYHSSQTAHSRERLERAVVRFAGRYAASRRERLRVGGHGSEQIPNGGIRLES